MPGGNEHLEENQSGGRGQADGSATLDQVLRGGFPIPTTLNSDLNGVRE